MTNWKDIHKNFAEKGHLWSKHYQQAWEKAGLTAQGTQEWINSGCQPDDYDLVAYARLKDYQPSAVNLEELRREYENWEKSPKSAQEYLDINYPKDQRKDITKLDINEKQLTGSLDLTDFVNLEELSCRSNRDINQLEISNCIKLRKIDCWANWLITSLDFSNNPQLEELSCGENFRLSTLKFKENSQLRRLCCPNCKIVNLELGSQPFLKEIICWHSQLTNLSFLSQLNNLQSLTISNNNFSSMDLTIFSQLTDLRRLDIARNSFVGSLEPFQNLTKLNSLSIGNTELSQGLEHLPDSLINFCCINTPLAKILKTYGESNQSNYLSSLQKWREDNIQQPIRELTPNLSEVATGGYNSTGSIINQTNQAYDWKQHSTNLEKELNKLSAIVFLDKDYNFTELKQEITRLKYQELASQIRSKRTELEQLTNAVQGKLTKAEKYLFEKLLKKHSKLLQPNSNTEKLNELKENLSEKLTNEELQTLLTKQTELSQLEKHLASLQQNQEQVAQIQQNYSFKQ